MKVFSHNKIISTSDRPAMYRPWQTRINHLILTVNILKSHDFWIKNFVVKPFWSMWLVGRHVGHTTSAPLRVWPKMSRVQIQTLAVPVHSFTVWLHLTIFLQDSNLPLISDTAKAINLPRKCTKRHPKHDTCFEMTHICQPSTSHKQKKTQTKEQPIVFYLWGNSLQPGAEIPLFSNQWLCYHNEGILAQSLQRRVWDILSKTLPRVCDTEYVTNTGVGPTAMSADNDSVLPQHLTGIGFLNSIWRFQRNEHHCRGTKAINVKYWQVPYGRRENLPKWRTFKENKGWRITIHDTDTPWN